MEEVYRNDFKTFSSKLIAKALSRTLRDTIFISFCS